MSDPEKIAGLYQRFLEAGYVKTARDPKAYPLFPVMRRVMKDYSSEQRGRSVLDIGCGPGLLKEAADYEAYAGIDASQDMLAEAAGRGYQELICAPINNYLPVIADASYDSVICFSVAYFLSPEETGELVAEMQRIAGRFWLLTLDGIPEQLAAQHEEEEGIPLYNHVGMKIPGAKERFMVEGWKSPLGGQSIPMEVIIGTIPS